MERDRNSATLVVLGAGAIGCHLGGAWSAAFDRVVLLGRMHRIGALQREGLRLTGDPEMQIPAAQISVTDNPAVLETADVICIATKATALPEVRATLKRYAPKDALIVSLMNGVSPSQELITAFPDHTVCAGMVPYNVVWRSAVHLHKSSVGRITLQSTTQTQDLAQRLARTKAPIALAEDVTAVQYGKLLLNLINPINALSGLPLRSMLAQKQFRAIYAAALQEALQAYDASGTSWEKAGPFSPRLACKLLHMPDWAFNASILRIQKIDPHSMTSMAQDVHSGKPTEIESLNQEIVRIGQACGVNTPVNAGLVTLIRSLSEASSEPPKMTGPALRRALGL